MYSVVYCLSRSAALMFFSFLLQQMQPEAARTPTRGVDWTGLRSSSTRREDRGEVGGTRRNCWSGWSSSSSWRHVAAYGLNRGDPEGPARSEGQRVPHPAAKAFSANGESPDTLDVKRGDHSGRGIRAFRRLPAAKEDKGHPLG